MGASTAGYCVGNLLLDRFTQSWEDPSAVYPANLASPLQILIDASNGASDYGNKFGEPLIAGYTRTFGMRIPDGSRREWIKPIMFRWAMPKQQSACLPTGRCNMVLCSALLHYLLNSVMSGSTCDVDGVNAAAEYGTAACADLRVLCTGFICRYS